MQLFIDLMNFLSINTIKISFFNVASLFNVTSFEAPFVISVIIIFIIAFSFYLEFLPVKYFFKSILDVFLKKKSTSDKKNKKGISSISAMLTTVASNTGLGSTAGMALMIVVAGPGTVFWLPFAIIFCISVKMVEIYLGHKYREKEHGVYIGGPFLYLKNGLSEKNFPKLGRFLSTFYLVLILILGFFGVSVLEMNQFTKIITNNPLFLGQDIKVSFIGVVFVGFIILGGIKRISALFNFLMPILVSCFVFFSIITIFKTKSNFINALNIIYSDAFNVKAGFGAILASIIMAFRRISVSTETGFGTAGIIHASSGEENSMTEALKGMISPVVSGFFIAILTSFLIVITGIYKTASAKDGIIIVSNALAVGSSIFPYIALILTVIMALNVTIGWSYYGVSYAIKIFGKKAKYPYLISYLFMGFAGGILNDFEVIMNFVDAFALLIPIINLLGIAFLIKDVKIALKYYLNNLKKTNER